MLIFNSSLASGSFPSTFKHSIVHPLLKKLNLDPLSLSWKRTSHVCGLPWCKTSNQMLVFTDSHTYKPVRLFTACVRVTQTSTAYLNTEHSSTLAHSSEWQIKHWNSTWLNENGNICIIVCWMFNQWKWMSTWTVDKQITVCNLC